MASTSKPQKKLGEFLNEEQEPFVLQLYLLERGCSRKWNLTQDQGGNAFNNGDSVRSLERSASSVSNKRMALLPFSRVLTSLCNKFASYSETPVTRDSDNGDEDTVSIPQTERVDQKVVETERFSSASSSTLFNSCSEIGEIEEETWISSHKDKPSFISDTCRSSNACNIAVKSQQATSNGKHRRRYIEHSPALLDKMHPRKAQLSQNKERVKEDVGRTKQRILNSGVVMPKKITEDSLLSAALWGLLIQSAEGDGQSMDLQEILATNNVPQVLKSKRALHKTKQLLFDCVREIAASFPRTDEGQRGYKQLLGAEELGNLICQKTKEWGQQAGDQTNLTYLLSSSDHLKSIGEWSSDFEPHRKDISFDVADAILDRINNEIVSEMVDIFTPSI